jgi:YVTN family beta-propeller protein
MLTDKTWARRAAAAWIALLLASCGGGGGDPETQAVAQPAASRERALALPPGLTIPADAHTRGVWGPVTPWPLIAVHGVLTADGRVVSYGTKADGTQTGLFIYDVWNPADDSHLTIANGSGTDIFCSSQLMLPAGDAIVISGGDNWTGTATTNTGNNNSTVLDLGTNVLTRGNNMNRARWYSTSTTLLNGETYVQGGSGGTDRPEVRDGSGVFRLLSGANTSGFDFMYPRNFVAPDGRVFGYDSAGRMYYINPTGTGAVTTAGQFASATAGNDASAAMFAPGRILQYGGNSNQAIVIDINSGAPSISATSAMLRQRRLSVATILADGKVVATGGSSVWNQMTNVSYEAEIWNPQTGQWSVGASMVKPRLYHGNALLLPDASVLVFGGGAPSPSGVPGNLNREIYYPPYLFAAGGVAAVRPSIDSAPTVVDAGRTVQIATSGTRPVSRVTFVKTGSATHGWNMEQRFVDLPFNAQGSTLSVQIPGRASDVPPGMWMMFVIDEAGVPSEAKLMRVNVAPALDTAVVPLLASPGSQVSVVGTPVDLPLSATDPNGDPLRWTASGLPPGLGIDAASGRISGTPSAAGVFTTVIAVSDGYNGASTTVTWTVNSQAPLVLDPPSAAAPSVAGSAASFTASASGQGVTYSWDFGDGTPVTDWSPNPEVNHVFTRAGVFYVTVTARDTFGGEQRRTIIHNAYLSTSAGAPSVSGNLALETRSGANARLWAVNPDNDSVSVFDAVTRAKLAEIAVGAAPRTLALTPSGAAMWVVNKRAATISVISTSTLAVTQTIALPRASSPYGVAMARTANVALVALEGAGVLLKLDAGTGATLGSVSVGPNPRHVSVSGDGSSAYVSRFITPPLPGEGTVNVQTMANGAAVGGEVVVVGTASMALARTIVLAHSFTPDAENQGRGVPNYLGAAALSPDGTQAFVPGKQDNILRGAGRDGQPLNFQNTVRAISSRIDLATQQEDLSTRIDHDNASMASAAAFDPLGVYLFVALETSREVAVLDAHARHQLMRIDVGRAPQGVLVSPDRRTLYVHNFMDRTIGVFDLRPMIEQGLATATPLATLNAVGTEKLTATVLRGKQFFYDARDTRLARDRYMSCASCHNDGGHDGRVWDLTHAGEGLRNTISLRGRSGAQGFLHWSNNFDEVQDFEGQIRTLAGGTGLMTDAQFNTGTRSQPLGSAKAGVSSDLDALAAYVASLNTFDQSPARASNGALSALAGEGRSVFTNLNCASCHGGTAFTNSGTNNPSNIGTIKPSSGQRLGGVLSGIDVPTLRDVWATAPYLHDGSAATLADAVRAHNNVSVNDTDLNRLVAYLREIGSEEASAPSPQVNGGGLVGRYYGGMALAGNPLLTRTEAVNFNWGSNAPGTGVPANQFSVRWSGTITMPTTGSYRFRTVSDDGVRLWLGGTQRINNWTNHASTANTTGTISFTAGQRVAVTLEYYENGGQAVMQLQWRRPGTSTYVAIPITSLNAN